MAKAKHPKQPNDSKASRWSSIGWFLWLVGPPLLAAAITFSDRLAPPTPLPTATALPAALPNVTARRLPAATPLPSANDPSAPSDLHDGRECSFWASDGECERNSAFMLSRCARSCLKLGHARQAYDQRCPAPAARTPALLPGEMPRTFERIVDDFAALGPEMLSHDPPIVLFRNFLADDEAEAFIAHGAGRYSRSLGVGLTAEGKMGEVKTEIRTSSHGWCQHEACLRDPRVERATARVANVTRTGEEHFEFAQLVYYHACNDENDPECAFYRRHTDYIAGDKHRLQGVRVYTMYLYLNDVPSGGGTRFTDLPGGAVTVQPKKGQALLWPSVYSDFPDTMDPRTHHEALPVTKGEKFGAVFWVHQHDFKTPHKSGCTAD